VSKLFAAVANWSEQVVNQNTNVAAEVCKVARKRTSGLTVIHYFSIWFVITHSTFPPELSSFLNVAIPPKCYLICSQSTNALSTENFIAVHN